MAEYLKAGKIKPSPKLATALFYRINVLTVVHVIDLIGVPQDKKGTLRPSNDGLKRCRKQRESPTDCRRPDAHPVGEMKW